MRKYTCDSGDVEIEDDRITFVFGSGESAVEMEWVMDDLKSEFHGNSRPASEALGAEIDEEEEAAG